MRQPINYSLHSNWEYNQLKLEKDANAKKLNVKRNIVNVTMWVINVENFVNAKDVKTVELYLIFLRLYLPAMINQTKKENILKYT